MEADAGGAVGGLIFLVIDVGLYIFFAYCLFVIAQKTSTENAWLAFIPIVNIILILNIAGKPIWWIILLIIPIVNIVFAILVMMAVAEARSKPSWKGILTIIPLVNFIAFPYLAFSE